VATEIVLLEPAIEGRNHPPIWEETPAAKPADSSLPAAQIWLLDGFELECDGLRLELPLSTQRLLAFLAIHQRPLLRTFVAGSLWLDKSEERSYANLRSALWRLRQPGACLVEARASHIRLAPSVKVDLHRAVVLARALIEGTDVPPTGSEINLLLAGDLLRDWYDEWVEIERERLRQLRLHALEALCVQLTNAGRLGEAIDIGLAAVAAEPLRESAHRVLIEAHMAEGNVVEAARQFERYRDLLWEALGAEPSGDLDRLLAGRVDFDLLAARARNSDAAATRS
jgi:DNA-binding SARP family transcriptional activator